MYEPARLAQVFGANEPPIVKPTVVDTITLDPLTNVPAGTSVTVTFVRGTLVDELQTWPVKLTFTTSPLPPETRQVGPQLFVTVNIGVISTVGHIAG